MKGILGLKIGMTQIFDDEGNVIPVTVVQAGPCYVIQKKTKETDGYNAIQLGFLPKKMHRVNKPLRGHMGKAGRGMFYYLREIRLTDEEIQNYEVGQEVTLDIFEDGEYVDVTGTSKGRGFAGVMKRWNFGGGRASHGSKFHRTHGSTGMCEHPGRTFKGTRMAGHYGNERVTIQNLKVVGRVPEKNYLLIKGAIPGPNKGLVIIKQSVKKGGAKK